MNFKTIAINLAVVPAILGLALASHNLSAEDKLETVEIHVEQENDAASQIELILNGNSEKFALEELANGESRTIVTESGKTIVASKDMEGNTTINIDGKEVRLFQFQGDMGANFNFVHGDGHDTSHFVENKIMILGGNLSDEVKAAIKATLASYNVTEEVVFPEQSHSKMMFITDETIDSDGNQFDFETISGKRIKIIKEVEKN